MEGLVAELIAAAEAEFRLTKPRDDGKTPRELGEVNNLKIPDLLSYCFELFYDIKRGAAGNIDLNHIRSWSDICGIPISPFDTDVILRIDAAFIKVQGEETVQAPRSIVAQLKDIKEHHDNLNKGVRMKTVNPKRPNG